MLLRDIRLPMISGISGKNVLVVNTTEIINQKKLIINFLKIKNAMPNVLKSSETIIFDAMKNLLNEK